MSNAASRLLVVLDPDYGDRLREVWPGCPVWVVMSPANEPVIRSLWASHPQSGHLAGMTGFSFVPNLAPEDQFVEQLDSIDLHHGPYSTNKPFTEIQVIGCDLGTAIRQELVLLDFTRFEVKPDGFTASRSREAAARRRA